MDVPEDGVLIHGLFMDAFRWDDENQIVTESRLREMNPPLPMLHMEPKQNNVVDPTHYISSLYRTAARAGTLSTTGLLFVIILYFYESLIISVLIKRNVYELCGQRKFAK